MEAIRDGRRPCNVYDGPTHQSGNISVNYNWNDRGEFLAREMPYFSAPAPMYSLDAYGRARVVDFPDNAPPTPRIVSYDVGAARDGQGYIEVVVENLNRNGFDVPGADGYCTPSRRNTLTGRRTVTITDSYELDCACPSCTHVNEQLGGPMQAARLLHLIP